VESSAKPIVSLYVEDPTFEERIDRFVVGLAERVDAFQDAEAASDRAQLQSLAAALAAEAEEIGYPAVAEAGRRIEQACSDPSADALHKSVLDLTELSQRVRRGHRSAAG
jgi:hypothetical protein